MEKILVMQNTKVPYGVDKKKPAEYNSSRLFTLKIKLIKYQFITSFNEFSELFAFQ